jgi:hypothetical protein
MQLTRPIKACQSRITKDIALFCSGYNNYRKPHTARTRYLHAHHHQRSAPLHDSKVVKKIRPHFCANVHGAVQGEVIDEEATQGQQAIVDASRSSCGQHDHHSTHRT